jgi:hypothetical protein
MSIFGPICTKTLNFTPDLGTRTVPTEAVARPDSKQAELIGEQLGSNAGQSNGFDPCTYDCGHKAPRRGFNQK